SGSGLAAKCVLPRRAGHSGRDRRGRAHFEDLWFTRRSAHLRLRQRAFRMIAVRRRNPEADGMADHAEQDKQSRPFLALAGSRTRVAVAMMGLMVSLGVPAAVLA